MHPQHDRVARAPGTRPQRRVRVHQAQPQVVPATGHAVGPGVGQHQVEVLVERAHPAGHGVGQVESGQEPPQPGRRGGTAGPELLQPDLVLAAGGQVALGDAPHHEPVLGAVGAGVDRHALVLPGSGARRAQRPPPPPRGAGHPTGPGGGEAFLQTGQQRRGLVGVEHAHRAPGGGLRTPGGPHRDADVVAAGGDAVAVAAVDGGLGGAEHGGDVAAVTGGGQLGVHECGQTPGAGPVGPHTDAADRGGGHPGTTGQGQPGRERVRRADERAGRVGDPEPVLVVGLPVGLPRVVGGRAVVQRAQEQVERAPPVGGPGQGADRVGGDGLRDGLRGERVIGAHIRRASPPRAPRASRLPGRSRPSGQTRPTW